MKIKLSLNRKKILQTCAIIFVVVTLYMIYREEIFLYSCNNEQVAPSCMLAGSLYEERFELKKALKYYEKSCELKYGLGCFNLSKLEEREGFLADSKKHRDKACRLGHKTACKKN